MRSQRTRTLSDACLCSTGSPQGRVLSPLLFVLYTNDCQSTLQSRSIIKFADDSVIVSLLQDKESDHGPVLENFIKWCDDSYLELNGGKTKEMFIDFRRDPPAKDPILINGSAVERVSEYKYLGTVLDDKLSFDANTDHICKKANQRLFFLRKLRGFQVDRTLMRMFYSSCMESILTYSITSWFGNLSVANRNRLGGIIKVCQKTIGTTLNPLKHIHQTRVTQRAKAILVNPQHPLFSEFRLLPSGCRYAPRNRKAKNNRYTRSFVPSAVGFINELLKQA